MVQNVLNFSCEEPHPYHHLHLLALWAGSLWPLCSAMVTCRSVFLCSSGSQSFSPGKLHLTLVRRGLILERRLIKVWAVYYAINDSFNPSVYQPLFLVTPGNSVGFFPQHYWHKIDKTVRCLKYNDLMYTLWNGSPIEVIFTSVTTHTYLF